MHFWILPDNDSIALKRVRWFFLPRYFNQLRNINNKTLSNAVFLKIQGQLIFRFSRWLSLLVLGSFSGKVYLGPGHVFVLC